MYTKKHIATQIMPSAYATNDTHSCLFAVLSELILQVLSNPSILLNNFGQAYFSILGSIFFIVKSYPVYIRCYYYTHYYIHYYTHYIIHIVIYHAPHIHLFVYYISIFKFIYFFAYIYVCIVSNTAWYIFLSLYYNYNFIVIFCISFFIAILKKKKGKRMCLKSMKKKYYVQNLCKKKYFFLDFLLREKWGWD